MVQIWEVSWAQNRVEPWPGLSGLALFQADLSSCEAKLHALGVHPTETLKGVLPHHELIFDRREGYGRVALSLFGDGFP